MPGRLKLQRALSVGSVAPRSLANAVECVRELHDDHAVILASLLNRAGSAPGLTIGSSSKAKIKIANNVAILAGGVPGIVTAAEVAFTATTHDITANVSAARERWYLLSSQQDGTVTLTAGTQGATGAGTIPTTPADEAPLGLVLLTVAAGATDFDASSDNLDAAHITDLYYDLVGCPNPADVFATLAATKPTSLL